MKSLLERIRDRCRVDSDTGCWHWTQARTADGYPLIAINALGVNPYYVHRLVYLIEVGPLNSRKHVIRTCWNNDCVAPAHLRALSPKQAAALAERRERRLRGALATMARLRAKPRKLTREKVREIRARLDAGATQVSLAREYAVSTSLIHQIARNKSWREATPFVPLR